MISKSSFLFLSRQVWYLISPSGVYICRLIDSEFISIGFVFGTLSHGQIVLKKDKSSLYIISEVMYNQIIMVKFFCRMAERTAYMNIIVCVKQVPGTNKVAVDPVTGVLIRDGVDSKINPYDLFALEEGFSLAEKTDGRVRTLSMGPPQAAEALKETLYMGADSAVLLSDRKFGGADVAATSCALELGIKSMGEYDLIICGKQTTDGDTAQVGPELAERLGIEHISNVTKILECDGKTITVVCDLDKVHQTAKIDLPCLITIEKDANTPRLPSYNRKKSLDCDELIKIRSTADFPDADISKLGLSGSPTQVERIFPPEKNTDRKMLDGDAQAVSENLFNLLKDRKFI